MAKDCNCAGGRCGCLVVGGAGINVIGTGTASNPFSVSRNTTTDSVDSQVDVDDSTTIRMMKVGEGTASDPVVLRAEVVLASPNGNLWTLAVSNTGTLTATAL
jgi:hypothetical protein